MSKTPAVDLAALIDARLELDAQIVRLESEKKDLAEQIMSEMYEQGLKQAFGNNEQGYRRQEGLSCDYGPDAYGYSRRNGLDPIFTAPPKITRAKVIEAYKKKLLTDAQFTRLQKCAGPEETKVTLVTIQRKEKEAL